jgi:putative ABC transport system ATP-binding protein
MTAVVNVDRATVEYTAGIPVLRDVTLHAEAGRMLAVTGASGAGKTTLLRALAGILRPVAGTVEIDGRPLLDRDDAVARSVVLISQDLGLATILTAAENVQVVLLANGFLPEDARRTAARSLEQVGLVTQSGQLVEELSGGQKQRTAIARGLALAGRVLLADEITSELDATNRNRVLELLRLEADRGACVVFATHDLESAAACDSELHLVDGSAELVRG